MSALWNGQVEGLGIGHQGCHHNGITESKVTADNDKAENFPCNKIY